MATRQWAHHSEVEDFPWRQRWPNFTPAELACSHCGKLMVDEDALDALQRARRRFGEPVYVACWYRCPEHPIEAAKKRPGSHSRGTAGDTYPQRYSGQTMKRWLNCLAEEKHFWGFGMGLKGGSMHHHQDRDEVLGERAWGY